MILAMLLHHNYPLVLLSIYQPTTISFFVEQKNGRKRRRRNLLSSEDQKNCFQLLCCSIKNQLSCIPFYAFISLSMQYVYQTHLNLQCHNKASMHSLAMLPNVLICTIVIGIARFFVFDNNAEVIFSNLSFDD